MSHSRQSWMSEWQFEALHDDCEECHPELKQDGDFAATVPTDPPTTTPSPTEGT